MMLLQLTTVPNAEDLTFLQMALSADDAILVSEQAGLMALSAYPLSAQCFIRDKDVNKLGGQCAEQWRVVNDQQWLDLTLTQAKVISW